MKKKIIQWKNYVYFSIKICNRLKELECKWKQPQSDISLINWYKEKETTNQSPFNKQKLSLEEYNLMISKAVEDGMLHVVGSYCDPIDGTEIRLLKSDKLFFPEVWL